MSSYFEKELEQVPGTIKWFTNVSIERLSESLIKSLDYPLFSVGSGGSFSAAHMAALLHQQNGLMASPSTPLNFSNTKNLISNSSVLILSANGKNPDIVTAFKLAVTLNPKELTVICMKKGSHLSQLAQKYPHVNLLEFEPPTKKDGFLATNSLIGFFILLIRAYSTILNNNFEFPIDGISNSLLPIDHHQFTNKETFFVLYSGWGLPPAVDAESKFSEAALANIQMVDYRNFAHGRHNWIAKRKDQTGIIALITPEDKEIAKKTLRILPGDISVVELETRLEGPTGSLELLLKVFNIVKIIGNINNIDPAKPKVPEFGRRLYHLTYPFYGQTNNAKTREEIAIWRKCQISLNQPLKRDVYEVWKFSYRRYLRQLNSACFGGLVFDYDGTLIDNQSRYGNISQDITKELARLLREGILLGIATGRGKSVREVLQSDLPKEFWNQILVGYYNGSDIAFLSDNFHPDTRRPLQHELGNLKLLFDANDILQSLSIIEYRPNQIVVLAKYPYFQNIVKSIIFDTLVKSEFQSAKAVESSHSIDIVPSNVSKYWVVDACKNYLTDKKPSNLVLCFGDQGQWPGNDYQLLSHPFSISVNTVSPDPKSCWNIAPLGLSGPKAILYYLKHMKIEGGLVKIKI